jgi:hypothetical protein
MTDTLSMSKRLLLTSTIASTIAALAAARQPSVFVVRFDNGDQRGFAWFDQPAALEAWLQRWQERIQPAGAIERFSLRQLSLARDASESDIGDALTRLIMADPVE